MVKPFWKKVEAYLFVALMSAFAWLVQFIMTQGPDMLPPQWKVVAVSIISLFGSALMAWVLKLRNDAYKNIGLTAPAAAPQQVTTLAQAAQVLGAK